MGSTEIESYIALKSERLIPTWKYLYLVKKPLVRIFDTQRTEIDLLEISTLHIGQLDCGEMFP
jgi:hypothetical protein